MALTPLPTAPSTSDPANFATRADALVAALVTMVSEINSGAVSMAGGTITSLITANAGIAIASGQTISCAATATMFAGATTLLTIGGTGASASLFMPSTLDATSSVTGAIRTSGGISAAKAANFGTTLTVGGITTLGGALVGAASQDVFNTVSTTVNAFGAATTVNIGAANTKFRIGNTATMNPSADDLIIGAGSGSTGMTIYSGAAGQGAIYFADGDTGTDRFSGYIYYDHAVNLLFLATADAGVKINIGAGGVRIGSAVAATAALDVTGAAIISTTLKVGSLGAFASSDKYVIVDSSGNFHKSALGPAS